MAIKRSFNEPGGPLADAAGGQTAGGMAGHPALDDLGGLAWRAKGLVPPAARARRPTPISAARTSSASFLGEWCEIGHKHLETAAALYAGFCAYARTLGETPGMQRGFAARLDRHGLIRKRLRYARVYRCVRLRFRGEIEDEAYKAKREGL